MLAKAHTELAAYYPIYAEFEPLKPDEEYKPLHRRLLGVDDEGLPQVDPLNAEFDAAYLERIDVAELMAKSSPMLGKTARPTPSPLRSRPGGASICLGPQRTTL